jgi:uncharacterized protein (DUF736 family)
MLTPGLEPISDPGSSISFTEIDTVWKNYGEGEMSEYHSLSLDSPVFRLRRDA